MCKVSVIVPVYNKEQYLKACLDSLANQTLRDIEILCVDDKSSDGSPDILLEYAEKDSRVRVIWQECNGGVSKARNAGIWAAKGEFIAFVDADDFVEADFYEKLYAASAGFDCVKGEIWDYDDEIKRYSLNETYNLNEKIKSTGNPVCFFYGFTCAIYRRAFIERYGLHFPEGISYFEDPYFTITLAARLSAIRIVDGARYCYRTVPDSLSHGITPGKTDQFQDSVLQIISVLKQCALSRESKCLIINQLVYLASSYVVSGLLNAERYHRLEEECTSLLDAPPTDGKIKVSVIVPVYNGEKYLRRTLSCLLLQSLYDIEIICVNDKSKDGSLEVLKAYQKKDQRIRIIDCTENGGESRARNIGIGAAEGEYIAFMDQDDTMDVLFLEKLYQKATETGADIVKGEVYEVLYNGQVLKRPLYRFEKQPLYFSGDWWTAIYRRSMVLQHHVELPEGYPLGGDLKFLFDACMACKKLAVVHGVNYNHLMHSDSGDSEQTPLPKIRSVYAIFSYILGKVEEYGLSEKDRECYLFYYYSYLQHMFERIRRCPDLEGKLLCIDFIFRYYDACRLREGLSAKLRRVNPLIADALENHQRHFLEQMIKQDALSEVFYEKNRDAKGTSSVPYAMVVPYIQEDLVEKYIVRNAFLREEKNASCHFVDNRAHNRPISVIYNEFLDETEDAGDAWLILMHSDFEFLSFPSEILGRLDPSKIYGPVGAKIYSDGKKMYTVEKGAVYEKTPDNTLFCNFQHEYRDPAVDTLDCMCLIVHSSLVKKYHLRFDEQTLFDLYAEDFCIHASRNFGIPVETVSFDCAHHSSYAKEQFISRRYIKQLDYINHKYPDSVYGGTVTEIGGKPLPAMSDSEFQVFRIRQEILTGKKL